MSRQLEVEVEQRETKRRSALVMALEFSIVGGLESQGMELRGLAFRYDGFTVLLTVKVLCQDRALVSFVGSDTFVNCILKADYMIRTNTMKYKVDEFVNSGN